MGSAPAAPRTPTPNAGVAVPVPRTERRNQFGVVSPPFCLFSRRRDETLEEAEHGVAFPVTSPDAGSTPAASTNFSILRAAALAAIVAFFPLAGRLAASSEPAKILWRGNTFPLATADADFRISDAAKALGFEVTSDPTSG